MTKRLITSVLILGLLIGGFLYYKQRSSTAGEETLSPTASSTEATSTPSKTPTKGETLREEAWHVFEHYLEATKAHDVLALKEVVYKLSPICTDPESTEACYKVMDSAYSFGADLKQDNLTRIVYDDKQVILSTDSYENLEGDMPSITKGVLYFVRSDDGALKFLSMKPFEGVFLVRPALADSATSTIIARLQEMSLDSDKDFVPDETELCKDQMTLKDCVKTNPYKKDTNNNGWWDSIEQFIK